MKRNPRAAGAREEPGLARKETKNYMLLILKVNDTRTEMPIGVTD